MVPIWLKYYPKGIPHKIKNPVDETLVSLFQVACEQNTNSTAFSCLGEILSFQTLYDYSLQFATYLQQNLQIKRGDRVAIMMPNILQYPVALFGIHLAGGVVVNLNPLDKAHAIEHELNDSGARAIIVLENFVVELQKIVNRTKIEQVILTSFGALFPPVKGWLVNFFLRHIKNLVPEWKLSGAIQFRQALKLGESRCFKPVAVTQKDLAFLQYTGGTTGKAKGVKLSHGNLIANLYQVRAWLEPEIRGLTHPIIITALPLYHVFSLMANCLLFTWLGGENVLIPNPRDIKGFIKTLKKKPFHGITGVNTLFNALNHHQSFCKLDFSQLKITIGGGMAVQHIVAEEWHQNTGCHLTQAYGLTETSPAVSINVFNTDFDGTIGPPLPLTLVKVIDDNGRELPVGHKGELCVKGPQVMQGYWQHPKMTKTVLDAQGWFKTGDIAILDERGFIKLVDRKKDTIIVSGFNVYPTEVEEVIMMLPEVLEVGVIGVPDPEHGETVKAFIVKQPSTALTVGDVIAHCHRMLAAYKSPHLVDFVNELPKSQVGKILKRKLK